MAEVAPARRRLTKKTAVSAQNAEADPPAQQANGEKVVDSAEHTPEEIQAAMKEFLADPGARKLTLGKFRKKVACHLGLGKNGLDDKAEEFVAWAKALMDAQHGPPAPEAHMAEVVAAVGEEVAGFQCLVYLATVSRLLPETATAVADLVDVGTMSRAEVATAFRDAFDNPVTLPTGGRPRSREGSSVKKLVVFREQHATGEVHYHVAILLHTMRNFMPAKLALRQRHKLAAHFSCSHTQFWSAVRYGYVGTIKKPEVDKEPFSWSADGKKFDLYEASQRPWTARMWKRRREEAELVAETEPSAKKARFSKLDLTAVIIDRSLKSKAEILEYAQDVGCEAMQHFVANRQKHLQE